jgi:hypothetical protein
MTTTFRVSLFGNSAPLGIFFGMVGIIRAGSRSRMQKRHVHMLKVRSRA